MSGSSPERPRRREVVVHPRTAAARTGSRRAGHDDVSGRTELGVALVGSLRRAQLRLATIVGLVLAAGLGGIPLVFLAWPGLREARVGGLAVGWILLGVLVFPAICLGGWAYVRAAERNEAAFVDLVERS